MSSPSGSLYNRHRPTTFADLVGQDHVERALGNALRAARPAQGYLFSGPRGTGKTTTARILARCLNCQSADGPTAEPCGTCDSCLRTGRADWMDVVEVDAASSARRIDEIRDWIETVRYAPVACRYRVTIMDEAHQIQDQAASALLKTLEEPPPQLVVILCTTHAWDILPTIRSRLQHFVLRRPEVPELKQVIERVARAEDVEVTGDALDALARAADGSYRDALGLLDQLANYTGGRVTGPDVLELIGAADRATLFELVQLVAGGDPAGAFGLLVSALDGGVDPSQLIRSLTAHLRYVCLLQQGAHAREEWGFGEEELHLLAAQANQLDPARVVRGLDLLADAQLRIHHGAADPRLQLELVVAKLGRPELDADAGGPPDRAAIPEGSPGPVPASPPPAPVAPPAAEPPPRFEEAPPPEEPLPPQEPPPPAEPSAPAGPPPPREPSPHPPAEAAAGDVIIDREHLTRLWPRVVDELSRSPHLAGFLTGAALQSVEGDAVTLGVAGEMAATMLGQPENRAPVEAALSRVAGTRLEVTFEAGAPAAPPPLDSRPAGQADLIEEIKTMFDAVEENDA